MQKTEGQSQRRGNGCTGELADFIVGSHFRKLPEEAVVATKKCLLDWLGVAIGGSREPGVQHVIDLVKKVGGAKQASILGVGLRTDVVNAALANGTMSHVLDYDDAHNVLRTHPSAPLIAALLPVAEHRRVITGRDFITAMVVGVEASSRVGSALGNEYYEAGWHATAILGRFGAATGVGRLIGLDRERMCYAIALAATQAGGLRDVFGTMSKAFHAGKAAADGVVAAMLAESGLTAPLDILDKGSCFSRVFSPVYRNEAIAKDLGKTYDITNISFKPYAACLFAHPVVDALILIGKEHRLVPEEIEAVRIKVAPINVSVAGNEFPSNGLEGKFSIHFVAALAIVFGGAGNSLFTDDVIRDTRVRDLMKRIKVTGSPGYTETETTVSVELKEGTVRKLRVTSPKGDPKNPLSFDEIQEKFIDLCRGMIPTNSIERIAERVRHLEDQKDMAALARLSCRKGRE